MSVVVFARLPVKGLVKTRLASTLPGSHNAAVEFYRRCAEHTFRQANRCAATRRSIYCSVASDGPAVAQWLEDLGLDFNVAPQADEADLGKRMRSALACELRTAKKVVLIGSDIPDIEPGVINMALMALDEHDVVLGPACDGGFYLIGLTLLPQSFLEGLTWSTEHVLRDTAAQAAALGLSVTSDLLPRLTDIDTAQDLQDWLHHSETHELATAAKAALQAPSEQR